MQSTTEPFGWENWRAQTDNQPLEGYEYACYTDAHVTGEVLDGLGPYQLLNTTPVPQRPREAQLAVVLRVDFHVNPDVEGPRELKTQVGGYHGGNVADEIASLVSLALDRRLKAAGVVRSFLPGEGPQGYPRQLEHRQPYLAVPRHWPLLPRMTDTILLDDCVPLLQRYPRLSAEQANALLRAARSFQQGLWVAEDDSALAWIKLISAVETAAAHRGRSGRARKKFIDFLVDFLPSPPTPRPVVGGFNWSSTTALRRALGIIHDWRSKELHEGIPFPAAMCHPPMPYEQEGYVEIPEGLATHSGKATWAAEDAPMLLHTFKHIVGGALRAWWQTMP